MADVFFKEGPFLINNMSPYHVRFPTMEIGFSILFLTGVLWGTSSVLGYAGDGFNGFDISKHNIPLEDILSGGPPRDGIPAIMHPVFLDAHKATFLHKEDRILGIQGSHGAKAYPIKIMNWHEIVNDTFEGHPLVITYCPLCGTGIAFKGMVQGRTATFGVSGLLYQSDLLMYDHETQSLWSQIAMEAVAGPLTGEKLDHVFLEHTTWGEWLRDHPHTVVLSTQTGYRRNYNRDPYLGYAQRAGVFFPTHHSDSRYFSKELVVGVEVKGRFKAYPFSELQKAAKPVHDVVNGRAIIVRFHAASQSASVSDAKGRRIPSVMAYWFAWIAFHPHSLVFTGG